jgi:SAM-dependent methyltransferase
VSARVGQPAAPPATPTLSTHLRHLFGLKHTFTVDDVRYRERSSEPLRHALSKRGPGRKDYDVRFPSGQAMRISATAQREYADLVSPGLMPLYERAGEALTPGLRVLVLSGGTGYAGHWVAQRVGPSGAVVSLEEDEESVAYARRRYPVSNVAFETGDHRSLSGEVDGAFDAVLAIGTPPAGRRERLAEAWRLVGPHGWLYTAAASARGGPPEPAELDAWRELLATVCTGPESPAIHAEAAAEWLVGIVRRPDEP